MWLIFPSCADHKTNGHIWRRPSWILTRQPAFKRPFLTPRCTFVPKWKWVPRLFFRLRCSQRATEKQTVKTGRTNLECDQHVVAVPDDLGLRGGLSVAVKETRFAFFQIAVLRFGDPHRGSCQHTQYGSDGLQSRNVSSLNRSRYFLHRFDSVSGFNTVYIL